MTSGDRPTFDPVAHRELRELLPWLANGTLTGAERRRLVGHLERCAACRRELEEERALRAAVAAPRPWPAVDAETSLAAMFARIDAGDLRAPDGTPLEELAAGAERPAPRPTDRRRLDASAWRRGVDALWRAPRAWRLAALVPTGVAAVLALLLVLPASEDPAAPPAGAETGFELRSDAAPAGPALRLWIRAAEGVSELQLRRLLLEVRADLVSGPTAGGVYTIVVPLGEGRTADNVLEQLAAQGVLATVVAAPSRR